MFLLNFLHKEKEYLNRIGDRAKILLLSHFLFYAADPIFSIFLNAFILRKFDDFALVAICNLLFFIGLPLGFLINGYFLKKISIQKMFLAGLVLQGVSACLIVFINQISPVVIIIIEFAYGFVASLYWANRSSMEMQATDDKERNYYSSLDQLAAIITRIFIPIIFGWFIVLGDQLHIYDIDFAYKVLAVMVFIIFSLSGIAVQKLKFDNPEIKKIIKIKAGQRWARYRGFIFLIGFFNGVTTFLPGILILTLVGDEGSLGTVTSIAALVSGVAIYYIGKRSKIEHRENILGLGVLIFSIGAIVQGIFYSSIGAISFMIFISVSGPFLWFVVNPIVMKAIEDEVENNHLDNYEHIFDSELFLNIGRVLGIILFVVAIAYWPVEVGLRVSLVVLIMVQGVTYFAVKRI